MNPRLVMPVLFLAAETLAVSSVSPAAPLLEEQNLFEAGSEGYYAYRIPGLIVTGSGAMLATVEARRGKNGDWDDNDVLSRHSLDGGRTRDKARLIAANKTYGAGPISNFVMLTAGHDAFAPGVSSGKVGTAPAVFPPPPLAESSPSTRPARHLANDAEPSGVDGRSYDVVVMEATPGGVAMAVRAAREGLRVLLVQHNHVLGGMLSNGLGVWDTLHLGHYNFCGRACHEACLLLHGECRV